MIGHVADHWCGENQQFWNWTKTWQNDRFELSECFERTALVWIPCTVLWLLLLPFEVHYLRVNRYRYLPVPWTRLNTAKLALNTLLILISICDIFVFVLTNWSSDTTDAATAAAALPIDYFTSFVKLATFALSALLLLFNKNCGLCTSGALFLFWFLLTLTGSIQFAHELQKTTVATAATTAYRHYTTIVNYGCVLVIFVLNWFADRDVTRYESGNDGKKPWPEQQSSFLRKLTFSWVDRLIWTGFRRPIEIDDFWTLKSQDRTRNVVEKFERYWTRALKVRRANAEAADAANAPGTVTRNTYVVSSAPVVQSVFPVLCKSFGPKFLFATLLKVFYDCLQFTGPIVLELMIGFLKTDEPNWHGYVYSLVILIATMTQTLILGQYFHRAQVVGVRTRTALTASIYRKALRMSNGARTGTTVGEIVNLMSVDANRFVEVIQYLNMLWSAPLQIALAIYFLWQQLGASVLAGLTVMIVVIPFNAVIANKTKTYQMDQMKNKDERVKKMNEILNGIKVLKLYGWETSFEEKIVKIRNREIRVLKRIAYLNSMTSFIWSCAPFLVSAASFATYVYLNPDSVFDSKKAFVSLSLFNILRFPISMLPMMISYTVQSVVSLRRINDFMNNEDLDDYVVHSIEANPQLKHTPIIIEHGSFQWSTANGIEQSTLSDINVDVERGSLCAVVGIVGSGKSSLLAAIMGEMIKTGGQVYCCGSMALVQQQAWIQNATLRDNILFGQTYKKSVYDRVIESCALTSDLEILKAKDLTEIGEKGINLSGGQKQRVSLARAVYNDADIYLLDDPLSAVDSHVGKHIFDRVLGPNGLLKQKTRVLVTHSLTYLPQVDKIFVLNGGRVTEVGTYRQLMERRGDFADFVKQYLNEKKAEESQQIRSETIGGDVTATDTLTAADTTQNRLSVSPEHESTASATSASPAAPAGQKIIEIERAEIGKVKWAVYLDYAKSIGVFMVTVTVLFNIIYQIFLVSSNLLLSEWTNDTNATTIEKRDYYLHIYGLLGAGQVVAVILSSFALFIGFLNAALHLHNRLLKNILRSPCNTFFDVTPVGRILNRFGKDIETLDTVLPTTVRGWLSCLCSVSSTLIIIAYAIRSTILIILPIVLVYYMIQKLYVPTSRQIKRIESISRSPIYSHFSESLSGTQTIRAFKMQDRFIRESDEKIDLNQTCCYPNLVANRWLAVRLEMIGNLIIFVTCGFAVVNRSNIEAGIVALAITYSLQITQALNWLVRMSSDVETNIVSVERIKEYSETEREADWESGEILPDKLWPQTGRIEFRGFGLRYRPELDFVLHDLSFVIESGRKVGIVGRTGAGKSSLTLALFRIVEPSCGSIIIDDVDVCKLGLHTLRSKLTIIPQDPVLFSGTIRENLDPFSVHRDCDLWQAIENSHLMNFVRGLANGLDHEVSEGGENLSVGQRQLICLARALLRKTTILILDEATAAVDLETDDLIQKTIRKEFKDCTVLTIAHRLNTIMDSDQVLVLEHGRIAEFDSPANLLARPSSKFYEMAKDSKLVQ